MCLSHQFFLRCSGFLFAASPISAITPLRTITVRFCNTRSLSIGMTFTLTKAAVRDARGSRLDCRCWEQDQNQKYRFVHLTSNLIRLLLFNAIHDTH